MINDTLKFMQCDKQKRYKKRKDRYINGILRELKRYGFAYIEDNCKIKEELKLKLDKLTFEKVETLVLVKYDDNR
jgi:hypothetical protein